MRLVPWQVEAGGRRFSVRPIRVRDRIRLADELSEERAKSAAADARLVGMTLDKAAEHVASERRKALSAGAIIADTVTPKGALRVLSMACDSVEEAIALADSMEQRELTVVACEALGVDFERRAETASGNG